MVAKDLPTLAEKIWDSVDRFEDRPAQTWYDGETWHTRTYGEFGRSIQQIAGGLVAAGIEKGDRVAIWSKNSIRWAEVDLANQMIGAVTVPVYDTLTGGQAAYILEDSGAKLLFVQDESVLDRLKAEKKATKGLKEIVALDGECSCTSYDAFAAKGAEHFAAHPSFFQEARESVGPDDLASLVYTSGTTGNPKGVMLTHANFASNALLGPYLANIDENDKYLSFLPLSHVFERTGGHFMAYISGAHVVFARDITLLTEDMVTHSPTIMMSVPRLYEKIYAKITKKLEEGSPVKRFLFAQAVSVGRAANVYRVRGVKVPASLRRRLAFFDMLVYKKLRQAVGGKLRYFVSGGAALNKEIEEFFWAVGIEILQGYGLTETSPVVHVNYPGHVRFGSVGHAVPRCETKIDTTGWESARKDVVEGEICVRGPMVMKGYFHNDKATQEVMDEDGFFHTGDIGYIDDDGFLFITDRKKEILVLANGKNVAPQPIEGLLKLQPHIEQACIIGDDKNFVTALLVPDFEALEEYAATHGIVAGSGNELVATAEVRGLFEREVEAVNAQLARFEQIKKFEVLGEEWTVEGGELTPSLKLKRRIILDKFQPLVEKLYEGVQRVTKVGSK